MINRPKRPIAHRVIYKPNGPAAEYSVWGCNIYKGCAHQCTYCYLHRGPMAQQMGGCVPEIEKKVGGTKEKAYQRFCKEVDAYQEQFIADGGIFFSFSTDPMLFATVEMTFRCALYALERDIPVFILTKAVHWTALDYVLGSFHPYRHLLHIGFTLTGHDELEPMAPKNILRIDAIRRLHEYGFQTFASIEPVIDFTSSLEMILQCADCCDEFRIGLLSPYSKNRYDWEQCDRFMQNVNRFAERGDFRVVWKESINKFYREGKK